METRSFSEAGRGSFLLDIARIALGVFIGGLAALLTYEAIVGHRAVPLIGSRPAEPTPPADTTGRSTPAVDLLAPQPPPQPTPQQADAAPAMQERQQAQDQKNAQGLQDADELRKADDLKSAQELAARLEGERQQRRAVAWARFFQPSPVCRADPTTRPCADAHLAARKRFDAQYVDR